MTQAEAQIEVDKLELELESLQASNLSAWNTYGSELCAGDMIAQENKLREKIKELRSTYNTY